MYKSGFNLSNIIKDSFIHDNWEQFIEEIEKEGYLGIKDSIGFTPLIVSACLGKYFNRCC